MVTGGEVFLYEPDSNACFYTFTASCPAQAANQYEAELAAGNNPATLGNLNCAVVTTATS